MFVLYFPQTSSHQSQRQSYDPPRRIPRNQLCGSANRATVNTTRVTVVFSHSRSREAGAQLSPLSVSPVVIRWRTSRRSAAPRSWSGVKVLWRRGRSAERTDRCCRGRTSLCTRWSPPTPWRTSRRPWSRWGPHQARVGRSPFAPLLQEQGAHSFVSTDSQHPEARHRDARGPERPSKDATEGARSTQRHAEGRWQQVSGGAPWWWM